MSKPFLVALCALSLAANPMQADVRWPAIQNPLTQSEELEAKIDTLLSKMTLEEKVGQMVQAEIRTATPAQTREFHLGSILNGGGSWPQRDALASVQQWRELAQAYYEASMASPDTRSAIPILWGTDAVHGHNNLVGATLFPHNVGLGAINDTHLMTAIGRATALETAATGIDWTFAPTLAVARDDRWGRTYESYSEDPQVVARLGAALVRGLEGENHADVHHPEHILTTAKHFIGDGGTASGADQGDTQVTQATLLARHAPPYYATLAVGTQIIMASFSSWQGDKLHGHKVLLTDILREQMEFDGFVLGDWNGHQYLPGCSITSCAASINAGVDMFMVPDHWRQFIAATLDDVANGRVSHARIDEAVSRILRVKLRAGLFAKDFEHLPDASVVGSTPHRALARDAARKSLVLLKNQVSGRTPILPLDPSKTVLVTGNGADNLARQTGGWTINWQGTDNPAAYYRGATTIRQGIAAAVEAAGGTVTTNLRFKRKQAPDYAIVVFGEPPYAEGQGDRDHLEYAKLDKRTHKTMARLKKRGIPVIGVFLSGRPMVINTELKNSDAFVAAWLPGSEGGAIADALFGIDDFDFSGRLAFSWPANTDQSPINHEDDVYAPLFPFGYGLTYRPR